MTEKEIKEWDNALLDLLNKGLIKVIKKNGKTLGFALNKRFLKLAEGEDICD